MIQLNDGLKSKLRDKDSRLKFAEDQMNEFISTVLMSNGVDTKNITDVVYFVEEGKITFKEKEQ
jgi:hypothetical protein